jgi:hypothetical protein
MVVFSASAEVRQPAVAGSFYPGDKGQLEYQLNKLLLNAPSNLVKGDIVALVVPHAGYPYSGQVAAYGYKQLLGKNFDTVILIGASHRMGFGEIAVPDYDSFETPLGKVPVDLDFVRKLKKISGKVVIDNKPHRDEHALEVQLPFLQTVLKDFKIVPVLFGSISLANCQELAYALSFLIQDNTLIIASSDLSHYYSYDMANKMDNKGNELIVKGDLEGYIKALSAGDAEACGAPAVITTMLMAPALGANKVEILKYANSGDVTEDKTRVVGYASIVFYHQETKLSENDKKELLRIARKTIENHLSGKKVPDFKMEEGALTEKQGAFVTLTKDGKLRGCIGMIRAVKPLYEAVRDMAVEAATGDPRFPPVTKSELKYIRIEISALSKMRRVKDISEITVGRDGLYLIKGGNSGLLLPQVPVEWGWDRDEFLKEVCLKAGLPEDAWKSPDAMLYRFSADVFHE